MVLTIQNGYLLVLCFVSEFQISTSNCIALEWNSNAFGTGFLNFFLFLFLFQIVLNFIFLILLNHSHKLSRFSVKKWCMISEDDNDC